jgi:tRNA modification GTPase
MREGMTVALAGAPNTGKSTLMNRLAGSEAAIVTDIPGTTRDVLRENISLGGLPLTVVDTAGLRDSDDPVEKIGIERAWAALDHAELVLFLVDDRAGVTPTDQGLLARVPQGAEVIIVRNKSDLSARPPAREQASGHVVLRLSSKTGEGLDLLKQEILRVAGLEAGGESLFSARTRHVDAIQRALACACDAQQRLREGAAPELTAEDLRLAQQALAEITGAFTPDDLLGRIFGEFCIGK